ncbi:MAG TPA: formate dehydrogenase subunit delta [Rhodocyclaceae bacterium]|nr:formate dehydrogenase subunit delta [Rhodocyclaceae bacterium]
MDIHKLIKMANQIGDFFEAWPDATLASAEVASHLQRYWAPSMREAILAHFQAGGEGLSPLVRLALASLESRPAARR